MKKFVALFLSTVLLLCTLIVPINISAETIDWSAELDDKYVFDFTNEGYYSDSAHNTNQVTNNNYLFDISHPWSYGNVSFDAGYGRGNRAISPVWSAFTKQGWGPQAWSYPGTATIDGQDVNTYAVHTNHSNFTAYFTPLKEDGKPFELAPGHKYSVKVKYYIEAEDAGSTPYIEYCAGLCTDKEPPIDYSAAENKIKFAGGRFAWLNNGAGETREATLTLDLTSLSSDENYDNATNTYTLTYGGVEYTLNNYFYFAFTRGTADVHFINLEITRDDYTPKGTINYYNGDELVKSEKVATGNYAPSYTLDDTAEKVFAGWYTDAALTNSATSVTVEEFGVINLYAKWEKLANWDTDLDKKYVFDMSDTGYYSDATHSSNQVANNNYLFDTTLPWNYGAISFDADFGRGVRNIYPIFTAATTAGWGPQGYMQPSTVEVDGIQVPTMQIANANPGYYVPLKADGTPFELAPNHTYTVKISYRVTAAGASNNGGKMAFNIGVPNVGAWGGNSLCYSSVDCGNNIDAWMAGNNYTYTATKEISTLGMKDDANYNSADNTYKLTYSGTEYTLYNYLSITITNYTKPTLDIISLEIIRDDYVAQGTVEYYDGESLLKSEEVNIGSYTPGYTPKKDDYVFAGWHSDAGLSNLVDSVTVVENTTTKLYAKWEKLANWDTDLDKKYVFDFSNPGYFTDQLSKANGGIQLDSAKPWKETVTFNAGFSRGNRTLYPVYTGMSGNDWGPQAWSQPGTVTDGGSTASTWHIHGAHSSNTSVFVPLKSDGTPFELAPGHKYSIYVKYYIETEDSGKQPFLEYCAGLYMNGAMKVDYSGWTNPLKIAGNRFAWLDNGTGETRDVTLSLDLTSLSGDENYDYATNTYTLTYGGTEYTLYNYFYFALMNGTADVHFVSLEITRDDYVETRTGDVVYYDEDGITVINTDTAIVGDYAVDYIPEAVEGKYFMGWYTDEALTNEAGSTITLTQDGIKLYSKWERDGNWEKDLDKKYVFDIANVGYYSDVKSKESGGVQLDATKPWHYGSVSYNAGFGRGIRSVYPTYSTASTAGWGPQAYIQHGTVEYNGTHVTTMQITNGNPAYFVPLKEDGTPFELAPGHKYTVKYTIKNTSVESGSLLFQVASGLDANGAFVNEQVDGLYYNIAAYEYINSSWVTSDLGKIQEKTVTLTAPSLDDENYDYKTNTYKLNVDGTDYTLYNYFYFVMGNYGKGTVDIISLEIIRDDYTDVKDGQFLVSGSVANNTTYKVSFDYALKNELTNDVKIGFKTTNSDGNVPTYIEGKDVAIYKILADKQVGTTYSANILLTTDMLASLVTDNLGFNDVLAAANSMLYGYIIGENDDVYIRNITITPLSDYQSNDLIGVGGVQILTDDAVISAGGQQAMRFTFNYDTRNGSDILIDGSYYTIKARGFIYGNGKGYLNDGKYLGDMNLTNARDNKFVYSIKSTDLGYCWTTTNITDDLYNIGFSSYITKFAVDDSRELIARGFIVVEIDGQEFTIYSDTITRSVEYVRSAGGSAYDPSVRQLVWGYDFSQISSIDAVTDLHQNNNRNNFTLNEYRNPVVGGENYVLEDGVLKLRITYSDTETTGAKYDMPITLSTKDAMSYKYGYLELEAEIPFERGIHQGFWLAPQNEFIDSGAYEKVNAEFDIFEVDGIYNADQPKYSTILDNNAVLAVNLHKWYHYYDEAGKQQTGTANTGSLRYSDVINITKDLFGEYTIAYKSSSDDSKYIFSSLTEARKVHRYGFEWNEEYIAVYVDPVVVDGTPVSEPYFKINISEGNDFYDDSVGHENTYGMDCFHEEQYILLSYCPILSNTYSIGNEYNNATVHDIIDLAKERQGGEAIEWKIHSIKLYQKAGEKINFH